MSSREMPSVGGSRGCDDTEDSGKALAAVVRLSVSELRRSIIEGVSTAITARGGALRKKYAVRILKLRSKF